MEEGVQGGCVYSLRIIEDKEGTTPDKVFVELPQRMGVEATHQESVVHGKEVTDHIIQPRLEAVKKRHEEEETTSDKKYNFCHEKCSAVDAFQVLDEKPKRNRSIKPIEWHEEGKENMSASSNVANSKKLDQLNPPCGLFKKPNYMGDNETHSKVQQGQKLNAQQMFDQMPKRLAFTISNENHEDEEDIIQLDHVKTSRVHEKCGFFVESVEGNWVDLNHYLFDELNQPSKGLVWWPFELDWKSVTSLNFNSVAANLGLLFTQSHICKWDGYSCLIPSDPGGMQSLSHWLPTDILTIHNLEAVNVVFDPGKLDYIVNDGVVAIMIGHSSTRTKSAGSLAGWLIGNHANYKHEIVIVVFDPGGKVLQKGGARKELIVTVIHAGDVQHLPLLGNTLTFKPSSESLDSKLVLGLLLRYKFRSQLPTQPHIPTWVQEIKLPHFTQT